MDSNMDYDCTYRPVGRYVDMLWEGQASVKQEVLLHLYCSGAHPRHSEGLIAEVKGAPNL